MDGTTMTAPIQVLALADVCGDNASRQDLMQVRFGWDAEGPWAAVTDSRLFVVARWRPEGEPPDEPVEFGVRPGELRTFARAAKKPWRWADVVTVGPGYVELADRRGERSVVARGDSPADWLNPGSRDVSMRCRGPYPEEPAGVPDLAPEMFVKLGRLVESLTDRQWGESRLRLRPLRLPSTSVAIELGEHDFGVLAHGLRVWGVLMGLGSGEMREWRAAGGVRKPEPAVAPELEPVLGGEGG